MDGFLMGNRIDRTGLGFDNVVFLLRKKTLLEKKEMIKMNKKMTRVIGIVAVLALIAVAFVGAGAAAADVSVELQISEELSSDVAWAGATGSTLDSTPVVMSACSNIYFNRADGWLTVTNGSNTVARLVASSTKSEGAYPKYVAHTYSLYYSTDGTNYTQLNDTGFEPEGTGTVTYYVKVEKTYTIQLESGLPEGFDLTKYCDSGFATSIVTAKSGETVYFKLYYPYTHKVTGIAVNPGTGLMYNEDCYSGSFTMGANDTTMTLTKETVDNPHKVTTTFEIDPSLSGVGWDESEVVGYISNEGVYTMGYKNFLNSVAINCNTMVYITLTGYDGSTQKIIVRKPGESVYTTVLTDYDYLDFTDNIKAGDCSCYVKVVPNSYSTITVTQPETGGVLSVSPSGVAKTGDTVTITGNPSSGYVMSSVTVKQGENDVSTTKTGPNSFTFTMPAGDVTVTGAFTNDTVTVTFNPNSGQGTIQTVTFANNVATPIPDMNPVFSWTGHTQTGWATTPNGTKEYEVNGNYNASGDATLYAVWVMDGSSGTTTNVKMITDSTFTFSIPSDVILSNYVDGIVRAGVSITPGSVMDDKDIVMRLASTSATGETGLYKVFDVRAADHTASRDTGYYADYNLNVYADATTADVTKGVTGSDNPSATSGGYTGDNTVVIAATGSAAVSQYLGFKTVSTPTHAGTYTGTLNFTVATENKPVTVTLDNSNVAWNVKGSSDEITSFDVVSGDTINFSIPATPVNTQEVTVKRGDAVVATYEVVGDSTATVTGFTYAVGTTETTLESGTPYTVSEAGTLSTTTQAAGYTVTVAAYPGSGDAPTIYYDIGDGVESKSVSKSETTTLCVSEGNLKILNSGLHGGYKLMMGQKGAEPEAFNEFLDGVTATLSIAETELKWVEDSTMKEVTLSPTSDKSKTLTWYTGDSDIEINGITVHDTTSVTYIAVDNTQIAFNLSYGSTSDYIQIMVSGGTPANLIFDGNNVVLNSTPFTNDGTLSVKEV